MRQSKKLEQFPIFCSNCLLQWEMSLNLIVFLRHRKGTFARRDTVVIESFRAVGVAQLTAWLLPISEELGCNPVIGDFY